MNHVIVREHARLTTDAAPNDLDCHAITQSAFDHLLRLAAGFRKSGVPLVQLESGTALKMDNYVGVVETPCGTVIEILPKHVDTKNSAEASRTLLVKMLGAVLRVPPRQTGTADIQLLRRPVTEWVMRQFVLALDQLVKRGIRSDYVRVEDEQRYLRGQLDLARQVQQPPARQHWFRLRHDVYSPDRAENRLLKLAVVQVRMRTRDAMTWRLSNELEVLLADIAPATDVAQDFGRWRTDRLMAHYAGVRPWCELVLGNEMPMTQLGRYHGMSLLFPMERLFEDYFAVRLERRLAAGVRMKRQTSSRSLCRHDGGYMFQLQPDVLLSGPSQQRWVLDTKWKRVDAANKANQYGLSQSDFYQLHAYGQAYLEGAGDLFLVFPKTAQFSVALPAFHYSDALRLHAVPFDLDTDELELEGAPFLATAELEPRLSG
ncbi:MAG TPA: McrC family protein [Ramlibacter sp.]